MIPEKVSLEYYRLMGLMTQKRLSPMRLILFERLLYTWMFIHSLCYLNMRELLWGPESLLIAPNIGQGIISNLYYILSYNPSFAEAIYFTQLIGAFVLLSGIIRKVFWLSSAVKVAVYLTGYILYYAAWPNFNAGFLLVLNYSFFAIFILHGDQKWKIVFSNFARLACIVMILFVYTESAMYKVFGERWLEGSAIYYAISLHQFSKEWSRDLILGNAWIVPILTYGGLLYQVLFPILVWIRKIKIPFLLVGVAFHLFIAVGMGLWDFGTAMLLGYVLFLKDGKITRPILQNGNR
jgi:hypothetical protein